MTCDNCPNHLADSNTCCHQSIKPTVKPSAAIVISTDVVERLKAQYDEAYAYYGDCYED